MSTLYDIINILPVSLLSVILFGSCTGMPEDSIFGFLICLIFSLWVIFLLNMKKKNRLRSIGIVAVFFVGLIIAAGEENRQIFIEDHLWVIHILCISACALTAGIIMSRNIWIRREAAVLLLAYCIAGTILELEVSREAFALICFIVLVRLAEEIQRKWQKSGCPDIREHITRTAPVFLAVCIIVYIIPAPDEPYDWQFAKDIYNSTVSEINRIYGYITHPTDDYGNTGFSDNGGFLSGLNGNDEEVLVVTVGNTAIKNCRLVGCISGDFTGREWVFDTECNSCSRTLDTIETVCAARKYAGASQSEFLQKTNMFCETLFYNTRYIFSPAKISLEATKEKNKNLVLLENNGNVVSEQRLNYKDNYLVSCYVLNYGNPQLSELISNAGDIAEAEWTQTVRAENAADKAGYSFDDYLRYRENIYSEYCHSCGVSEEVGDIIDEIKSGSESRYETLKNLETYLRKLDYSTNCGTLPDTVTDAKSYLDYFLLNSKKGYCMHFATAFVLMANEIGIPCRYVQGYIVKRDISGNMIVKQNNAHAWPEAYFDNVGWVAFEPTPGFAVPSGWGTREAYIPEDENAENETEVLGEEDTDKNVQNVSEPDPLIFIIPSAAVVCFLVLFYIISRLAVKNKYRRMSPDDRFNYLTRQNFRFLGYLGFRMEQGETLTEFTDRINSSDRQEIKDNIGFISVYETALYSNRNITGEDVEETEKTYHTLRGLVKKSRLRYRLLLLIKKQ